LLSEGRHGTQHNNNQNPYNQHNSIKGGNRLKGKNNVLWCVAIYPMLRDIMLSVFMQIGIMLSVIMLSVLALSEVFISSKTALTESMFIV
jgi:hypothetical protein